MNNLLKEKNLLKKEKKIKSSPFGLKISENSLKRPGI
jgi:hypothetical protein